MKEIKLDNYVGKDSIKIGNFNFKTKEKINFTPKKKKYLLSTDKKKYEAFNKLWGLYNEKMADYNENVKGEISSKYEEVHNKLKTMEEGNISNVELFLNSQIQERINFFRKTKDALIKKLNELEEELKTLKVWDIKKKMEIKSAIEAARKALNNLKSARREAKSKAKENRGVINFGTFDHSIINFKNINNLLTYNGIIGSLIANSYFINEYKDDDKWKKCKLKEIVEMQKLLVGGSKSYDNSVKTFKTGVELAKKLDGNNAGTQDDLEKMKKVIEELKKDIDNFIKKGLQDIESKKTNSGIKRYADKMKNDFETNKRFWASKCASSIGENGFFNIDGIKTFIDVYFQSKSSAVFKGVYSSQDQRSAAVLISLGVFQLVTGSVYCAVCPPVGMIILSYGIVYLCRGIVKELDTSGFSKNAKILSDAQATAEGAQPAEKVKQSVTKAKPHRRSSQRVVTAEV